MLKEIGTVLGGIGTVLGLIGTITSKAKSAFPNLASTSPSITVKRISTRSQNAALDDRIKYIRMQIDKGIQDGRVRQVAAQFLRGVKERDHIGELRSIYDNVRKLVRYTWDINGIDTYQTPMRTLEFGIADCDDYAILLVALLMSIGYTCKLVVIRLKEAKEWGHIYAAVGYPPKNPKLWIPLDASVPAKIGWEAPDSMVAERKYFDV